MLVVAIVAVVLVVSPGFYAMYRSKPNRFRLSASLLKLVSVSIEVDSDDGRGELPPARGVGGPE